MTESKKRGIAPSPATISENFQKAAQELLHTMNEKASVTTSAPPAPNRDHTLDGFTREKIACNSGPTYEFWGKLLGEYSTNRDGRRTKWTEIRLWATPAGQWVAESAGCSDEPGHVDILDAVAIRGPVVLIERQTLQDYRNKTPVLRSMEFQAMDFWKWSSPAKALAKKLKWDLKVQVD